MKKLWIYFITVMVFCASCYEDKGNYEYKTVPQVTVSGIEESYDFYLGEQRAITPTITWTNGKPDKISYMWKIDDKIVGEEENLDFIVGGLPAKAGLYAEFTIKNEDLGVEYINRFRVSVYSTFYSGWLLLADKGNVSGLSYIRDDGELYEDVYKSMNGSDLSGGAYALMEHWLPTSEEIGQIFVACQDGPEYSVELDGNSFGRMIATKDEFVGNVPADFKPMRMHCVSNYDYLINNGKLYVRNIQASYDAQYQDGLFPNFPYPGDYELANLGIRGNLMFSNDIICFDKKTSSYVLLRNGEMKEFDYTNDAGKAFVPNNMGKTVLDGGAISTATPTDNFLTILKSNTEDKAYVQKFRFGGWGAKVYKSLSEVDFPDPSIINENTKFAICQNRPYVYIASGNILYVYNHEDNTLKPLRSDFDRGIRDIAVCPTNYERLGIVLENADDASKSDFMELDVSQIGEGKTLEGMEFIGKFGRVVDLIYKIGNQWDTY